jgi:hypothetical protein
LSLLIFIEGPDAVLQKIDNRDNHCLDVTHSPMDTLREPDAEGDRVKAISPLEESLAISSELGMRPLMERVLSRREILKA